MHQTKWYETIVYIAYFVMLIVAILLNVFASDDISVANIIVTVLMFILVFIIFVTCDKNAFKPAAAIADDLGEACEKMERDALREHTFLYDKYRNENAELFKNEVLKREYADFVFELDRIEQTALPYYKCSIQDYINYDLMDYVLHRNILNQVAPAMTGLGILGTFIGLALGLNSFSTGSTLEIANSIQPLMAGIKVAFHTSIYGMVFSLVFNYSLRRRVEDAEHAVRKFVNDYKKYVLPDTANDGFNRLIELQQEQTRVISQLSTEGAANFSREIGAMLIPQFDRFDSTIENFANQATKNQLDSLAVIVNSFISEMNKSLDDTFKKLSEQSYANMAAQKENEEKIRQMIETTGGALDNIAKIQKGSEELTALMLKYVADVNIMHETMLKDIEKLNALAENDKALIRKQELTAQALVSRSVLTDSSIKALDQRIAAQQELLDGLNQTLAYSYDNVDKNFEKAANAIEDLTDTLNQIREAERHRKRGLFR
ncbi:MAG: MotA/TolQ/ExbB proton channel family protein [Lachnospiraceae bacterium]|nr:MotA/TolQ/ExbB proton channel family protein [Lachnospiraceae bacterium]